MRRLADVRSLSRILSILLIWKLVKVKMSSLTEVSPVLGKDNVNSLVSFSSLFRFQLCAQDFFSMEGIAT